MLKSNVARYLLLSLAVGLITGCAKNSETSTQPVVSGLKQTTTENAQVAESGRPGKPAGSLITEATLNKAVLLDKTYLYGSSLQFSSIVDGDISTVNLS